MSGSNTKYTTTRTNTKFTTTWTNSKCTTTRTNDNENNNGTLLSHTFELIAPLLSFNMDVLGIK